MRLQSQRAKTSPKISLKRVTSNPSILKRKELSSSRTKPKEKMEEASKKDSGTRILPTTAEIEILKAPKTGKTTRWTRTEEF